MKIIISHDVDHLDATDHLKKDLILPKLWVRSFLHLCAGKISFRTFWYRLTVLFHNRMNRTEEVMAFDKAHGIPSVFFFGMDNVLGMSYPQKKAKPVIEKVLSEGFDAHSPSASATIMSALMRTPLKKWRRRAICTIPHGSISRSWNSALPIRWVGCGNFPCTLWTAISAIPAE